MKLHLRSTAPFLFPCSSFILASKITPAANAASLRDYTRLVPPGPKRLGGGGPSTNFVPEWVYVWLAHVTREMLGSGLRSPFSWADQQMEPSKAARPAVCKLEW